MIILRNLSFKYDEQIVLHEINLEIEKGSFVAIIGANGSGKSTLAKHLNGLLLPTQGEVLIDGLQTKKNGFEVRKKVGFVFQNFEYQIVYPIVEEDIGFGLENLGFGRGEIKKIIDEIADKLQIQKLLSCNVNTLSFGQRQLVALAGVLAMKPEYIVFDEPTTMLDVRNKKTILSVIKSLHGQDKLTIVMATNSIEDIIYADRVIVLRNGRIIFDDKRELLNKKIYMDAGLYV